MQFLLQNLKIVASLTCINLIFVGYAQIFIAMQVEISILCFFYVTYTKCFIRFCCPPLIQIVLSSLSLEHQIHKLSISLSIDATWTM